MEFVKIRHQGSDIYQCRDCGVGSDLSDGDNLWGDRVGLHDLMERRIIFLNKPEKLFHPYVGALEFGHIAELVDDKFKGRGAGKLLVKEQVDHDAVCSGSRSKFTEIDFLSWCNPKTLEFFKRARAGEHAVGFRRHSIMRAAFTFV